MNVRVGFVSGTIGDPSLGLHVTLVRRYDATEEELVAMQRDTEQIKQMHLIIQWGNFCTMGADPSRPIEAYRVYFPDPHQRNALEIFHKRHYAEQPGKAMWPKPKYHVSVKTPAQRSELEHLIRTNPNGFQLTNVAFATHVDALAPLAPGAETWLCPICYNSNPERARQCTTPGCDQWKPFSTREGDWMCCGVNNFASRQMCMKCGKNRQGFMVAASSTLALNEAASAPPQSEFLKEQQQQQQQLMQQMLLHQQREAREAQMQQPRPSQLQGKRVRPDWYCNRCQFKIFGSKDSCGKCGTRNPNL